MIKIFIRKGWWWRWWGSRGSTAWSRRIFRTSGNSTSSLFSCENLSFNCILDSSYIAHSQFSSFSGGCPSTNLPTKSEQALPGVGCTFNFLNLQFQLYLIQQIRQRIATKSPIFRSELASYFSTVHNWKMPTKYCSVLNATVTRLDFKRT